MKALYEDKHLAKIKGMRGEIFILPVELIEPAIVATREQFQGNDLAKTYHLMARMIQKAKGEANPFEASESELEELKNNIIKMLDGECLTIEQLKKRLNTQVNISYIVYALCDIQTLIRGPTARWDNNKHHYTTWQNWLPGVTLDIPKDEAQTILVRSYIKSYGPVCLEDIVWWTGFSREDTLKIIKNLSNEVAEVSIDCFEGKYIITQDNLKRLKTVKYLDEPLINFLPSQDNYIVAYRRRSRHSVRDIYHKIHDRAGNVLPVVLIDGQVEGIWDIGNNRVEYTLFEKIDATTNYQIKQKARSLEEFLRTYQ